MARRGVATFAEVYAGLGFVYESFHIEDPDSQLERLEGDDVGFSILAGTQSGEPGRFVGGRASPPAEGKPPAEVELDRPDGPADTHITPPPGSAPIAGSAADVVQKNPGLKPQPHTP